MHPALLRIPIYKTYTHKNHVELQTHDRNPDNDNNDVRVYMSVTHRYDQSKHWGWVRGCQPWGLRQLLGLMDRDLRRQVLRLERCFQDPGKGKRADPVMAPHRNQCPYPAKDHDCLQHKENLEKVHPRLIPSVSCLFVRRGFGIRDVLVYLLQQFLLDTCPLLFAINLVFDPA